MDEELFRRLTQLAANMVRKDPPTVEVPTKRSAAVMCLMLETTGDIPEELLEEVLIKVKDKVMNENITLKDPRLVDMQLNFDIRWSSQIMKYTYIPREDA